MSTSSDFSGKIPENGIFSIKRWAEFFDSSEQSIRRWVKLYRIPYFKPGDTMFIAASDFIKRLPYNDQDPGPDEDE